MEHHLKIILVGLLLCLVTGTCQREKYHHPAEKQRDTSTMQGARLIIPDRQAYTGAYIDFGHNEDTITFEALEAFEALSGRHQAIIGFSNDWAHQVFPREQIRIITAYGAIPLIYWNPWERPKQSEKPSNKFNLHEVIKGTWDSYIDQWAREAAATNRPILVSWGLEMNGTWFPWSGVFYGGKTMVPDTDPPQYQGPETFKKAYRHVVDRVRAAGAANIQWVFHANNTSEPDEAWNRMKNYYPGDVYVDWLGLSAYGQQYPHTGWIPFEKVLPEYYREICSITPHKPFILAEWGVGEFPKSGSKASWLAEAFERFPVEFPRMKAAVYWHERWQNADGSYSNLRINSSEASLASYRKGIRHPFWLDRPFVGN